MCGSALLIMQLSTKTYSVTHLSPCKKPACTGADIQTTHESLSSSKAPPGTAPACAPAEGGLETGNGGGCTNRPEGLVSNSFALALGGGPAASCPVPQEEAAEPGMGGAEPAFAPDPPPGANGFPMHRSECGQISRNACSQRQPQSLVDIDMCCTLVLNTHTHAHGQTGAILLKHYAS